MNSIPQIPPGQFKPLGGLTFASDSSPQLYNTPSKTFSPRIGFAWSPDALQNKTVLSGGFSIFVFPLLDVGTVNTSGFSSTTPYVATNDNYISTASTLDSPFPNGLIPPTGSSLGPSTYQGQLVYWFNPDFHNAYSERYALSVQQQLDRNTFFQVAYIGAHYVKLPVQVDLNPIPRRYLSTSPVRDNNAIGLLSGSVANPFKGLLTGTTLNGSQVPRSQLLLPYPQYPADMVVMQNSSSGSDSYNSMNVRIQRRLTAGLSFLMNYTWSKNIEQDSLLNLRKENRYPGLSSPSGNRLNLQTAVLLFRRQQLLESHGTCSVRRMGHQWDLSSAVGSSAVVGECGLSRWPA